MVTVFPSGVVLHERARRFAAEGTGALSIKSFYHGRALYNAGAGTFAVDDRCYLVLNEGQNYRIEIDSPVEVESFCVFFARDLAADVRRNLSTNTASLLDDPFVRSAPPEFFERTYPHCSQVSRALDLVRRAVQKAEPIHDLMAQLLAVHRNAWQEAARLPAARPGTREELYRRLYRARDFAAASFADKVTLDDLARVACLSPNHLLRGFRNLFGVSPHQYLTGRRMEEARRLLRATGMPVTEICLAVGFESLGSFSSLFRRENGLSPELWRRKGDFREARVSLQSV
jgi:AraC-like DNA-binding protein